MDNILSWISSTYETLSIGAILILAFSWIAKAWLRKQLAELRPNGGSSIKDKVDTLTKKVDKLEGRVDDIYLLLVETKKPRKK